MSEKEVSRRSYVKYAGAGVVVVAVAAGGAYYAMRPSPAPKTPEDWDKPEMYPVPDPNMMPDQITAIQHDFIMKPEYFTLWDELYGRYTDLNLTFTATGGDVVPKLSAGPGHGIDVFHQDTVFWFQSIQAEVAKPLDLDRVPNYKYLFDYFKKQDSILWHEGKCYGVPFFIWKDTCTYDTNQIDVPPEEATLDILFDEEFNKKHGQKIAMVASHETILAAALYLDMPDPLDMTDEELDKCVKLLKDQRKYVRVYWESMSDLQSLFLTGEVNRAWCWEPVVRMVNDEDPKFNLVFPNTTSPTGGKGVLGGFEGWGMSVDVDEKHEYADYLFMNYSIGDDYFYRVFKALNYRPVSQAVVDRMTPEEVVDRGLDNPEALLDSMFMWALVPRMDLYEEKINELKAG